MPSGRCRRDQQRCRSGEQHPAGGAWRVARATTVTVSTTTSLHVWEGVEVFGESTRCVREAGPSSEICKGFGGKGIESEVRRSLQRIDIVLLRPASPENWCFEVVRWCCTTLGSTKVDWNHSQQRVLRARTRLFDRQRTCQCQWAGIWWPGDACHNGVHPHPSVFRSVRVPSLGVSA